MPTLPPTPSAVVSVVIHYAIGTDNNVTNKMYWEYSGGTPAVSDCQALASAIRTQWTTHLAPLMVNNNQMQKVVVQDLAVANGAVGEYDTADNGSRSGTDLPQTVCALWNHKIARKYRGGKPRTYLPFGVVADLNTDQPTWTTAFTTTFNTDTAAFVTGMNSVTGGSISLSQPCNVSYFKGYLPPTIVNNRAKNHLAPRATPVVDPILSSSLAPIIGEQRRRAGR